MLTLLAICKMFQRPNFWERVDSIVLLAYKSLAASRTLLQWLLACLNLVLDEELFCWYKPKKQSLCTMAAALAAENHGAERILTWYLQQRMYT